MSCDKSIAMTLNSALMAGVSLLILATTSAHAQQEPVVELTQIGCQFLEAENGQNHGYTTTSKSDCEAINEREGDARLQRSKTIRLKAGKYIFRVKNKNVPYALGFWLRGDGLLNRARLPSTSGGGLEMGKTRDYAIELVPGKYVYSCPLNPTPDYHLVVEG